MITSAVTGHPIVIAVQNVRPMLLYPIVFYSQVIAESYLLSTVSNTFKSGLAQLPTRHPLCSVGPCEHPAGLQIGFNVDIHGRMQIYIQCCNLLDAIRKIMKYVHLNISKVKRRQPLVIEKHFFLKNRLNVSIRCV